MDKYIEYCKALRNAQMEMPPVFKDASNDFKKFKYITYESIKKYVFPALHNNKITPYHKCLPTDDYSGTIVKTIFGHDGGHFEECSFYLPHVTYMVNKNGEQLRKSLDFQDIGAGCTYYKRYGVVLLSSAGAGDEDIDSDSYHQKKQKEKESLKPTPKKFTIDDLSFAMPEVDVSLIKDYVKMIATKKQKDESYVIEQLLASEERLESTKKTILKAQEK